MTPLNVLTSDWTARSQGASRALRPKYYLICEGANTEIRYFEVLRDLLAKQSRIQSEIRVVERTGEDRDSSHPKKLADFAKLIRSEPEYSFDKNLDKTVLVFDADVYKKDDEKYQRDILEFGKDNILAVTRPSFELFLLLHEKGAYEKYIQGHELDLYENRKVSGQTRYVVKCVRDAYGMNPKTNPEIGILAHNHDQAIVEEGRINQDITRALKCITSNVGAVINDMKKPA